MIDSHNQSKVYILARSSDYDLLGSGLEVFARLFLGTKLPRSFHDYVDTQLLPG